jgi:hypothetical protein
MKSPFQQAQKSVNIDILYRYAKTLALQDSVVLRHQYIETIITLPISGRDFDQLDKQCLEQYLN